MNKFNAFAPDVRLSCNAASRWRRVILTTLFAVLLVTPDRLVSPAGAASETHALFGTLPGSIDYASHSLTTSVLIDGD